MPVTHLSRDATPDEICGVLGRDGAVVIDALVEPAVIDSILDELKPHLEATPHGDEDFTGTTTRRTGALVARSKTCREELVTHPLVLATTQQLLGHATNFQLHLTQVISIGPGETPQPIHRDQWAFDFYPFEAGYEVQCNTIWAGTDFTEENGGTRVVVGSNNAEDRLQYTVEDTEAVEMTKGSCLLYTGSVYHGGGPNRSDAYRSGINITYNVAWLRQEENQYLAVPHDLARTFDDDLCRLLGYARGAYALGYVGDIQDALAWLRGSTEPGSSFGDDITLEKAAQKLQS